MSPSRDEYHSGALFNLWKTRYMCINKMKDIVISSGAGGKRQSSSSRGAQLTKQRTKTLHPPIETFWHLPPTKDQQKDSSGSKVKITKMLTKLRGSIKRSRRSQSLKIILEGSHDPTDEEVVNSFRQIVFIEGHLPLKYYDYHTLLRFLRMRDFDLHKAKEAFLNYLKWRAEFGVDAIYKEYKFEEYKEVKKCYPHGYHGVDRNGRPVYIERIGMVDLDALLQATTIERFVKYHVSEQEKTLKLRYPACSLAAKKHIASTTSILDVKDLGISNFSRPARQLFTEIQKIDSSYYPETLHRMFIVNASSGFMVVWKAIKTFLDTRTLAKIQVLGSNYKRYLIEVMDPSNLPSFLGGTCTCSDCGGCLFSDKGPWNDPDITDMLQAMVDTEEEHEDREGTDLSAENIRIKDVYDVTPPRDDIYGRITDKRIVDYPLLEKIQAFEAALKDAKAKIQMLEAALEDTKLVLLELQQQMEELKK